MIEKAADVKLNAQKRTIRDMLSFQIVLFISLVVFFVMSDRSALNLNSLITISIYCIEIPVLILVLLSGMRSKTPDNTIFLFMVMIFADTVLIFLSAVSLLLEGNGSLSRVILYSHTGYYICLTLGFWFFGRLYALGQRINPALPVTLHQVQKSLPLWRLR